MRRRFTLSVFALMIIAITTLPNQIQAQCTYEVVQSDGFEIGFGNWNDGSTDCIRSTSNTNTKSYSIDLEEIQITY